MAGSPAIIIPGREENRILFKTHHLDDEWLLSRLAPWLVGETLSNHIWACFLSETGRWGSWTLDNRFSRPGEDKRAYARGVVAHLNSEYHFDGAWIGAWMERGWTRWYLLWKDADGDIQIPIECDVPWRELHKWSRKDWGLQANTAHTAWVSAMEAYKGAKIPTLKRAQGQTEQE